MIELHLTDVLVHLRHEPGGARSPEGACDATIVGMRALAHGGVAVAVLRMVSHSPWRAVGRRSWPRCAGTGRAAPALSSSTASPTLSDAMDALVMVATLRQRRLLATLVIGRHEGLKRDFFV